MARILTGIQSTGIPHLGNLLGAMLPSLQLAETNPTPSFFFIADLHPLTTHKDPKKLAASVQAIAAAWLAFGLDPDKHIFYRQSSIPQVCELAWYLSCFTPYQTLTKAHAFKDKATQPTAINAGLFTYPILMAADMALYNATHVPVGKDQQQHLEIARTTIKSFNHAYGDLLTLPTAHIPKETPSIRGTDGRKMSKSYHNTINPFLPEKELYETIMRIQTDSTPLKDPKDPDSCNLFALYALLASTPATQTMRTRYQAGNYGYSSAKKALFELIIQKWAPQRTLFQQYIKDPSYLQAQLAKGESKARDIAHTTLQRIRTQLGYMHGKTMTNERITENRE